MKAKEGSDAINVSAASASAALVFECRDADGTLLHVPCDGFVEWLLCCMQSDAMSCDNVVQFDDDMHLLCQFAEHEGLRRVLLDCSLLPPFICLCFRLYFDMKQQSVGEEAERRAQLWLLLLLLLLFKMCDLDGDGPELVMKSFQSSGADDFAYVVHSLMQAAADNLSGSAAAAPLNGTAPAGAGFMTKCAAAVSKGKEHIGCLAVDLCSMLCCTSPESVSYAILSQALKPSLVMNLTLLLFQRLSSPTLQHQHERLAVSWLVLPRAHRLRHDASCQPAGNFAHVTPSSGGHRGGRWLRQHRLHRHPRHTLQQERVPACLARYVRLLFLHAPQPAAC